ncbi:MAG TPA: hypothetical protein VMI73_02990, partial [Trebonia sp.]|nr:hypothetical protein [Trebonia sp.]
MHDPVALGGNAPGEQAVHLVQEGEALRAGVLGGLAGVHLRVPAPQLPFDVAGAAHQVPEAGLGRVERVQGDEHVD